jgi:hypothetical protein
MMRPPVEKLYNIFIQDLLLVLLNQTDQGDETEGLKREGLKMER